LIDQIDLEWARLAVEEAIISASKKRVTPILLTTLTTVFGLVTIGLAGGALFEPMATLMIGYLAVATPLTLILVPCAYRVFFHSASLVHINTLLACHVAICKMYCNEEMRLFEIYGKSQETKWGAPAFKVFQI
jgi:hypothetical protein